jgi:hypothetical protein
MRCSVPRCAVTVQIRAVSDGVRQIFRFRPREAPIRKLLAGTKARLVRLRLSRAQSRGVRGLVEPGDA